MNAKQGDFYAEYKTFFVLLVLNLLLSNCSNAQLREVNSLGIVQQFDSPLPIQFPVFLHHSSSKYPDILCYDPDSSVFSILKNNGNGIFNEVKQISRSPMVTFTAIGNINNDGIDDIVIVHRESNLIEVLVSRIFDSTYSSNFYPVNFYTEKAVIGDITNDRISDIICYGKLSPGINVFQGRGNGRFMPAKTLFEDIPISEFSLLGLNGDKIADVAVHNWLTNETIVYLGLGKLKFSEQTILSFGQDTVQTLFADFNDDLLSDVAVASTQNKTMQILDGDGLGNFSFTQAIPVFKTPKSIFEGSFFNVGSNDIFLKDSSSNTFSLLLNRNDGSFYDEIIFGTAASTSEILNGDLNDDGLNDVMVFDSRNRQYSVIWNSHTKFPSFTTETSFAIGLKPSNLFINDLNNDGRDDIIVSNSVSSSLSVLLSNGASFYGQVSIETPEKPVAVSLYGKTDSTITFYTVHQESPKISLLSLRKEKDSTQSLTGDIEQFSISLPEKPVTVLPDVSFMQKGISLYAFMSTAPNAIVFYQQVKGTRFLTKSLVPVIPSKIIYSTINDLNSDGRADLLYVYSDALKKNTILGVTLNDSSGEFKGKVFSFVLPDSAIRRAILFVDDFNGDQLKDCLIYSSPENTLRLSLGNNQTLFGNFTTAITPVLVSMVEQVQIYDFDNDGIPDILISDKEKSELVIFRGRGNGKFFPNEVIADIPNESIFRCGDFNGDNRTDIVYTNPDGHTISVIYGSKN